MVTNETQEQLEARGWDFADEFIPDEPTVNNQDKTIDVSENGTIEVTPDEGFTGLGKVTVNTNVEGESSDVEYLDLDDNLLLADMLGAGIVEAKIFVENAPFPIEGFICSGLYFGVLSAQLREMGAIIHFVAASFNRDAVVSMKQSGVVTTQTVYELLVSKGDYYVETYNNLARLTKEQFYDLNA